MRQYNKAANFQLYFKFNLFLANIFKSFELMFHLPAD